MSSFLHVCILIQSKRPLINKYKASFSLTVAVHTAAFKLALKPHSIEASEDAGALKLPLHEITFIPKNTKNEMTFLLHSDRVLQQFNWKCQQHKTQLRGA